MELDKRRTKQATSVRRAEFVAAALELAAIRSPVDITTTDLAHAVGISQGAVFRHFASKEAIWLAVLDWATSALMEQLQTAARDDTKPPGRRDPLAALHAVFSAHVAFVIAHPGVPRIIFQELQHAHDTELKGRVRMLMQQYRSLIMQLLVEANEQQLLAPALDVQSGAVAFLGAVQGLILQSLVSGRVQSMLDQAPGVFSIYLRGITGGPGVDFAQHRVPGGPERTP